MEEDSTLLLLQLKDRGLSLDNSPCLLHNNHLWTVVKLFDDTNGAFMAAIQPVPAEKRFENLRQCSNQYQTLSVAVPSRATAILGQGPRLEGVRFAVKDMYAVAGLKNSLCSRPYYAIAEQAEKTAPCIEKLLQEGCDLVGMLKLSSFIGREEPTEAIDYQVPFNPRGEGYQSLAGSSSGSVAGIASYEWLDFTIGSDTTGSGRRPALVNGCFALRLSKGRLPTDGMVPTFDLFDTQCVFGRDIERLHTVLDVWFDSNDLVTKKADLPKKLLYPLDFFPVDNELQMLHIQSFGKNFSNILHAPLTEIDLSAEWLSKGPGKMSGESLQTYLDDVATKTFLYDFYHSFDEFREKYRKRFHREPYANEYTRWRWDTARSVTKEENAEAIGRLKVCKKWLLDEVFKPNEYDTYMILPVSVVGPNYRDRKTEPPIKQYAYDSLYISPTIEAPELLVPIAEFPYASRVSGRVEKLPIALSIVGNPGTDLALIRQVTECLQGSSRSTRVLTGSSLFPR